MERSSPARRTDAAGARSPADSFVGKDDTEEQGAFNWQATAAPSSHCTIAGQIAHLGVCDEYINCIPHSNGTFDERVKNCNGRSYSDGKCDYDGPICTGRSLRQLSVPVPELNYMCVEGFASECHNTKLAVECVDGVAYPEACGDNEVCDKLAIFNEAALCLPNLDPLEIIPEVLCSSSNLEIKADPYNTSMYLFCPSGNQGIPEVKFCGDGRLYDPDTKTCVSDSESTCGSPPSFPSCDSMGSFVHPQNCSWGYTCLFNSGSWEVSSECCPIEGEIFNQRKGICESACTSLSEPFTVCPDVGLYVDPVDCTKYYVCTTTDEAPQQEKTCPNGKSYVTGEGCVGECERDPMSHCIRPDTC
ncbi:uncharacterized protein LOC143036169 [Oratosquilla oratoria]|uniref:uncharacterized protein LOC143036169 n=1 Tax=Oratosquilla oratoria TaxID=337810 RepID=UPI003F77722A